MVQSNIPFSNLNLSWIQWVFSYSTLRRTVPLRRIKAGICPPKAMEEHLYASPHVSEHSHLSTQPLQGHYCHGKKRESQRQPQKLADNRSHPEIFTQYSLLALQPPWSSTEFHLFQREQPTECVYVWCYSLPISFWGKDGWGGRKEDRTLV